MIGNQQAFEMDADEFEIVCGFPKPTPDETLVFTCAAGIRSQNACAYAAQAGYMKLVNYKGGAYDWFTGN
jgi:rhodanese-related sulfurtransferase